MGAFKKGMEKIKKNFYDPIIEISKKGTPILGICLGMQMLAEESQEFGKTKGFNLINGKIKLMKLEKPNKIPYIGWEKISVNKSSNLNLPIGKDDNFILFTHITLNVRKKILRDL